MVAREGTVTEFGTDMYPLLHFKWITNKDLLYSTWNSAQCYGSLDGSGVWGRMDTCTGMAESLCHSPETITTLLIGYTQNKIKSLKSGEKKKFSMRVHSDVFSIYDHLFCCLIFTNFK